MRKNLTPRYIVIALVLAWAVYALIPTYQYQSLSMDEKDSLRVKGELADIEKGSLKQGLDLKGGIYIVLEVDLPTLLDNLALSKDQRFNKVLEVVKIDLADQTELDFFTHFEQIASKNGLRLLRYYHELGANDDEIMAALRNQADDAVNRVLEIIRNRVDQFGVSEPTIQKQGNRRIIVELAGIQDSQRARSLLQSTALLEFFIVKDPVVVNDVLLQIDKVLLGNEDFANADNQDIEAEKESTEKTEKTDEKLPDSEDKAVSVSELFGEEETEVNAGDSVTVDGQLFEDRPFSSLLRNLGNDVGVPEKNVYAIKKILEMEEVRERLRNVNGVFLFGDEALSAQVQEGSPETFYRLYLLESNPEITGGVVEEANATIGQQSSTVSGQSIVILDMNTDGSKKWAMVTGSNVGRRVAIVLDKKVHMAPTIQEKISGGGTRIEGFANMNEAKDIAIVLRAGALPVPVNIIEERVVGPSLGADSVRQGTNSVLIGLALVLIFMLVYYKMSGLIANFALVWNLILILAILAALGATLTLPGIAALILTVGMSIDANVIIFERIREELRKGKTNRAAIDAGYSRALTTIIDANITTVIAALVLYQFGTGPIRGFATVLFWGIVISMFTAIFLTRTIFKSFASKSGQGKMRIVQDSALDFMGKSRMASSLSIVLILAGIISLGLQNGPRLSIDFKGGTHVAVRYTENMDINAIRGAMGTVSIEGQSFNFSNEEIKHFGSQKEVSIRISHFDNEPENFSQAIVDYLYSAFPEQVPEDSQAFLLSIEKVGPKIGTELSGKAVGAILSALVLILIYISIRFEFSFALGAIAALAHDVLITIGIFSILDYEISLSIIAAFLTIVGYSLNDTIVIFDRIRENVKASKREDYDTVVNRSINESLGRTLITSLTTFMVVFVLWFYGGEVIHSFAFAMIIGVIVGTYSSIFVASPIVVRLHSSSAPK